MVCFPQVIASANLLYPVLQWVKYVQLWQAEKQGTTFNIIFVDLTWNPSLACLTMDVECRTFFSDAETVQSVSLMLWSLPTIKPAPGGGGKSCQELKLTVIWPETLQQLLRSWWFFELSLLCGLKLQKYKFTLTLVHSQCLNSCLSCLACVFGLCLEIIVTEVCKDRNKEARVWWALICMDKMCHY